MRVPVFPSDLVPNRGFKLIAKSLQIILPGTPTIKLMEAQELLSRGFGYKDFHDLSRSADRTPPDAPLPSQREVVAGIFLEVTSALQGREVGYISPDSIKALVASLPLNELRVFAIAPSVSPTPNGVLGAPLIAPKAHFSHGSELTADELERLFDSVRRTGSLRDRCLLGVFMAGVRPIELRKLIASGIGNSLTLPPVKGEQAQDMTWLTKLQHMREELNEYLVNPQPGDYLFPSELTPTAPMSARELSKVLLKWNSGAQVPAVSPHQLRISIAVLLTPPLIDSSDILRFASRSTIQTS